MIFLYAKKNASKLISLKNPLAQSNLNKILIWNLTEPTLSVSTFTKIATSCLPWEQKITERKKFQWSSSVIKDYGACDYQMITTRASHSSHCYAAVIKGSVNNHQPAKTYNNSVRVTYLWSSFSPAWSFTGTDLNCKI